MKDTAGRRVTITRRIEFDAGHRIPNHKSKCRNIHGHRYVMEATVEGPVVDVSGSSDEGMIVDFGDLKTAMMKVVGEPWDHAFLAYRGDFIYSLLLKNMPTGKMVALDVVPTAENLAAIAFDLLATELQGAPFKLVHLRLYETPNGYADAYGK